MTTLLPAPDPPPLPARVDELGATRHRRVRRVAISSIAAIAARIGTAATSILTVPVLLGYLGLERYGIWVTAGAVTAWVSLGHLGLGPSLLNRLASIDPDDRRARASVVASAWWLSLALGAAAIAVLLVADYGSIWASALNVPDGPLQAEARAVAVAMWVGVAASMPLATPLTILRADQVGYLASAVEMASSLARLAAIMVAVSLDLGVSGVALAAVSAPLLVLVVASPVVFRRRVAWPRPSLASGAIMRRLLAAGIGFTGMGVAGLLISSTDVIVIAHILGPSAVPPYAIAFSLLLLFVSLEMAVLDSIWPAYAEAAARGDRRWVRDTNGAVTTGLVVASAVFAAGLLLAGAAFIEWWVGPDAVPPQSVFVALAAIAMVQAVLLPHGRVLTALGHVRRNTLLSLAGAAVNLPASILLAGTIGVTGVALGTLAAYLVTGVFLVRSARRAIGRVDLGERATSTR